MGVVLYNHVILAQCFTNSGYCLIFFFADDSIQGKMKILLDDSIQGKMKLEVIWSCCSIEGRLYLIQPDDRL